MKNNVLLLLSRIILGGIFVIAGWSKVTDMAGTLGYFSQMGIPAFLTYIVSYAELIGGLMIILGLWSCVASIAMAVIMLGAIWFSRSMGFQGMMTPIIALGGLLALAAAGDGKFAIPVKNLMSLKGGSVNQ